MAFPGFLPTPQYVEGLACPTPELRELFWVEDVATPQPRSRYIFTGLNPTVRTDQALSGSAEVSAVVDEDGLPGLQAELILEGVWDVVLLDSFDDDICPGFSPDDPYSERTPFFIGGVGGRPHLLTRGHIEGGEILQGRIRPNPIAPGGLGASCVFHNLYLAVETWTGGWMQVTPVVNGEKMDDEAMSFAIPYSDEGRALHRFEVPLTREYDDGGGVVSRAGAVGTWVTCEIDFLDAWGCGRMEVSGLEVEFEVLHNHQLGLAYTGETKPLPTRVPRTTWFIGTDGGGLLRGGQGIEDDGTDYGFLIQTNDLAPAGVGGECLFYNVFVAVTRNNASDFDVECIPIVDGVELEGETLTFVGVSETVTEMQVVSLSQPFLLDSVEVSRYHPRGAWFSFRLQSDLAPDGIFEVDGIELEKETLTESEKDVTNA